MALVQIDRSQIQNGEVIGDHLATDAKSAVLASKNLIEMRVSADLSDPDANNVTISSSPETTEFPFSSVPGVIGNGSAAGIPVLLELTAGNSGQSHGFNVNSSKVWGGQAPIYRADVFSLDGSRLTDPNNGGAFVWAVITASARTTAGDYKIRFYSDEWAAASGEVTLSNPVTVANGYFLAYPKIVTLGDLSLGALRSDTVALSKSAAGIGAGDVGTANLADLAVTEGKIADSAVATAKIDDLAVTEGKIADGAVTAAKIAAATITSAELADDAVGTGEIADLAVTTAKIDDLAVTEGKIADGAVATAKLADSAVTEGKILDSSITSSKINNDAITEGKIADGAVATAKIAALAVTEAKIADAVISRSTDFATVDPAYGGVVMSSDTSAEGKVAALASPGMAVRVVTGGTGFGNGGRKLTIPTSANLTISAADATHARYDAVVVNAAGALAVRAGTPDASPTLTTLTAGDLFLAAVKVSANVTEITGSDVFDHRRGVGARKSSKVWLTSTATEYTFPRRLRGGVADVFRNGANLIEPAGAASTADEYAVTDPVESNGSVVTLGAAPSSSTIRISGLV